MKRLLTVLAAVSSCAALFAAGPVRTLRVGVYLTNGYCCDEGGGKFSGYGPELHARLAAYGGWEVEYVGAGKSWVELVEMLARGDIDALGPAQTSAERRQKFDFPDYVAGYMSAAVVVRDGESPCTQTAASWNGRRVALVRGSELSKVFEDFVHDHGLTVESLELDNEPLVIAALTDNRVDLAVVDSVGQYEGVRCVAHLSPQPFYTMLQRGDPALKSAVDAAYAQLFADDPEWISKLARKTRVCRPVRVLLPHDPDDTSFADYNRAIMDRVAEINDWAPEYIPVARADLAAAEANADVVAGISPTDGLRDRYEFSVQPAGENRLALLAPADRAPEFLGRKVREWPVVNIACPPDDKSSRDCIRSFSVENGLRYRLVPCGGRTDFLRLAAAKTADLCVLPVRQAGRDLVKVAEVGTSYFHFALPNASIALVSELDAAMERLRVYSGSRIDKAAEMHLAQPKLKGKDVVVAAYLEPGLTFLKEDGTLDGFNVRYIRRIAEVAGWRLRFVPTNFGNALRYLNDGVADVVGSIVPDNRLPNLFFSVHDMGPLYYTLKTMVDGRMRPNRPETWEGARIAVLRGSKAVASLESYLKRHGVSWQVVEFDSLAQAEYAASQGRVDAVHTLASPSSGSLRTLVSLPTELTHLAFNRKKSWLWRDADRAMKTIRSEEPQFVVRLTDRFFPERHPALALDPDEIAYVKERAERPISVGIGQCLPPLMSYDADSGTLGGFAASYLHEVEMLTGVRFAARPVSGDEEMTLSVAELTSDEFDGIVTDFLQVPTAVICRPGETFQDFRRLAIRGRDLDLLRLAERLGLETVERSGQDDCYRAVETKEADFTIDIYHRARYVQEALRLFRSLDIRPVSASATRLRLPIRYPTTGDPLLRSVMRKASQSIPEARIAELMSEALAASMPKQTGFTLGQMLDALGLSVVLGLAVLLLVMGYYTRRVRAEERAKSFVFSTVSHDIRTPLNAIVGFSEVLRSGSGTPEDRTRALEAIGTSGQTLLELINDVLDLSKLEAGKMDIVPEATDVKELVASVLHTFEAAVDKKGVRLQAEMAELPRMLLDPQRLRQILFNLIGNAVKFTERGTVTVRVFWEPLPAMMAVVAGHGVLRIAVVDTGCGIAPENVKKLMRPYVQLVGNRNVGGTGLGLSICKQLASRMGGKLHIASALGVGTTITLTVDVEMVSPEDDARRRDCARQGLPRPDRTTARQLAQKPRSELRVLIVDDSKVNLAVLKVMLRQVGVENVTLAHDGSEALAMLGLDAAGDGVVAPPFDFVLADVWMPVMSGDALVRAVRAAGCDIPVYAVTADVETVKTCEECGFTGIFLKPITVDKLKSLFSNGEGEIG